MLDRFLLLGDGAQNVAGPRDMRQINFGLEFVFASRRA
jgi:hypothetical protein